MNVARFQVHFRFSIVLKSMLLPTFSSSKLYFPDKSWALSRDLPSLTKRKWMNAPIWRCDRRLCLLRLPRSFTLGSETFKMALAIADLKPQWEFCSAEVKCAFIFASLLKGTALHIIIPAGHPELDQNRKLHVYCLNKNFYVTSESPTMWFLSLNTNL